MATLIIDQYAALNQRDPALCYQFASAGINAAVLKQIPAPLVQRELTLEQRIIETAARRAPVDEQQMKSHSGESRHFPGRRVFHEISSLLSVRRSRARPNTPIIAR